jgi:hypothetical protein
LLQIHFMMNMALKRVHTAAPVGAQGGADPPARLFLCAAPLSRLQYRFSNGAIDLIAIRSCDFDADAFRAAVFSSRLRSASSAFSCGPAAAHARRSGRDRRLGEVVQRLSVRLLREIIAFTDDERDGGGS